MDYFWCMDKKHFNLFNYQLNNLTKQDWQNMSCIVFLINGTHLWLDKLKKIQDHVGILKLYKIKAISFMSDDVYDDYISGKVETTEYNAFIHGLYITPNQYIFKQFVAPLLLD